MPRGSSKNTKIVSKRPPAQCFKQRDGKSCEKVHFPESWICNPHTPVQSKHTFLCSRFGRKNDQKSLPKAPQNRPKIIKKRLSSLSRIHAEKAETQNAKNTKKRRKWKSEEKVRVVWDGENVQVETVKTPIASDAVR